MNDIVTGERSVCVYCRRSIGAVIDPYSGMVDWGEDGDFGCDENPISNEDGCGGHNPGEGHTPLGFMTRPVPVTRRTRIRRLKYLQRRG